MPARKLAERFLVAFSFAGEQREFVRSIAEAVEAELGTGTVFFDEWFEYFLAGDDADTKLQNIYLKRCDLVVICVSQRYGEKPWTLAEHSAIRARAMKARASEDEHERNAVLPIRVGDGEVDGIQFNTIVPDVRKKSAAETTQLIKARLQIVAAPVLAAPSAPTVVDWPEKAPSLPLWPMANHSTARAAFEDLITRNARWRCLFLRGASETGKSHITRQMLANAVKMADLACGRFDFKGTADVDAEVRALVQCLDVDVPPASAKVGDRLDAVLDVLRQRKRPTLLIFDTYEAAGGEAQDWMEKRLLFRTMRDSWLRVVIAGQRVPSVTGAVWGSVAQPPLDLLPPAPEDWFNFGSQHRQSLTLELVRQVHTLCGGKASVLMQLFGPAS